MKMRRNLRSSDSAPTEKRIATRSSTGKRPVRKAVAKSPIKAPKSPRSTPKDQQLRKLCKKTKIDLAKELYESEKDRRSLERRLEDAQNKLKEEKKKISASKLKNVAENKTKKATKAAA